MTSTTMHPIEEEEWEDDDNDENDNGAAKMGDLA